MPRPVRPKCTTTITKKASSQTNPIPPFTRPSYRLKTFLDRLDPALIHITHIDRTPRTVKRNIFLIPVLLNTLIAFLLCYRLRYALPYYFNLLLTILGHRTKFTVDTTSTTRGAQVGILLRRVGVFAADFALARFVGPWPVTFFLERPANPCSWRWKLGVREEEVVVRVSRGWGAEELMKGSRKGEESAFWKTRVLPAVAREWMQKTGYLMMDGSWDLEFELMMDAHELAGWEMIKVRDLDRKVFAWQEEIGWVEWAWDAGSDGKVLDEREEMVLGFKEKLSAIGKENLFWKWNELVEEERSKGSGEFSIERQNQLADKLREEFSKEGVDFNQIEGSIRNFDAAEA